MRDSVVIYGTGRAGKYVYERLSEEKQRQLTGWIDNYRGYYTILEGRYVWTEAEYALSRQGEDILVCIQDRAAAQERVVSMLNRGWENLYLLNPCVTSAELPVMEGEGLSRYGFRHYGEIKPELRYMECHVTDRCNLKCRNCFHFCTLDDDARNCDVEEFRLSLTALKEKFSNIRIIRLMGGSHF